MTPPRRARGEGSVFYRPGRGIWEGRYRGRSVTAKTRPQLITRLEQLKRGEIPRRQPKPRKQQPQPPVTTLAAFVPRWLDHQRGQGVSEESITVYRLALARITRQIGAVALAAVTPEMTATAITNLGRGETPYAPNSIRKSRHVLRALYATAEEWELVTRNPVKTKGPRLTPHEPPPITADGAKAIIAALKGTRAHGPAVLGLYLGMRMGEILGLRWVDVADGRITVQGQYLDTLTYKARTKTGKKRLLPLLSVVETALRQARVQQAADELARRRYERTGFVFTGPSGRPLSRSSIHGTLTERLGPGRIRFHDLRHMTASLLHDLGVSEDVRRAILGHESAAIHRQYVHLSDGQMADALAALERALG